MDKNGMVESLVYTGKLIRMGNYNEAIERLEKLRKDHPDNVDVLKQLAESYDSLGDPDRKVEFFESVKHLNRPEFLESLAMSYINLNDIEKARDVLETALSIDQENYRLWLNMGRIKELFGDLEGALLSYKKSYVLSLQDQVVSIYLAGIHGKMGNYSKALKIYEKVLRQNPDNPHARAGLEICKTLDGLNDVSGRENVLNLVLKEEYNKDFANALMVALSAIANADDHLAVSEINLISMALRPFMKLLPGNVEEELAKKYRVQEVTEHLKELPDFTKLLIYQLSCELASVDKKLTGSEMQVLARLSEILELSLNEADAILRRTRPITWLVLEREMRYYRKTLDMGDLELLLFNWERYWRQFWEQDPLTLDELMNYLEKAKNYIEILERGDTRVYRFKDILEIFELQCRIKKRVFRHGIIIGNTVLSSEDIEKMILKLYKHDLNKAMSRKVTEMFLINRLVLALQQFCELFPSESWIEPQLRPSEIEIIIDKTERAVEVGKDVGLLK
ncbi:MAG: tetratricopeptide repeat protein [Candidatus Eremiobacteraeota bacterium]|nr:tetratricopeptide repeat protein [Candidatus Eremiobacteraeota bacterium]